MTEQAQPVFYDKDAEEDLLREERRLLDKTRCSERQGQPWNGIGLSGGGVRAATFSLGALQALVSKNLLKEFDYISSVSGGGYTASALQWWWHESSQPIRFGVGKSNFPYGSELETAHNGKRPADYILSFLRQHGKYLTPGDGLSIWSAAAVIFRTLFLNLAVWIPIATFVLALIIEGGLHLNETIPSVVKEIPNPISWVIRSDWTGAAKCGGADCVIPLTFLFGAIIWLAIGIVAYFCLFAVALAFFSFVSRPDLAKSDTSKRLRRKLIIWVLGVNLLLLIVCLALKDPTHDDITFGIALIAIFGALFCSLLLLFSYVDSNYVWRRRFETSSGFVFISTALLIVIGSVPILPYLLMNYGGKVSSFLSGALALAGGLGSALYGHSTQSRQSSQTLLGSWIATIGSAVFLYAVLVCSYFFAQLFANTHKLIDLPPWGDNVLRGSIIFLIALGLILGLLSNLNYVGLHRFYRDRIMEAFMPSFRTVSEDGTFPSPEADNLLLNDLWPADGHCPKIRNVPYPLINTNVVLVNDSDPQTVIRGGDNFVLSPLFVGSRATGWERTASYVDKNGSLTLASAMAASGAAINANSAYAGSGLTRDRLISTVMSLLNLRLGLWTGAPTSKKTRYRLFTPNHFHPGLSFGLFRFGYTKASSFVELTDGGHFDNIGLYELVRRRTALIVIIDAEADAETSMPALVSIVQRVKEDFGAEINLENGLVDCLIPEPGSGYPMSAKYVKAPYFAAKIHYSAVTEGFACEQKEGLLLYVKAGMIRELDFVAKGYWARNPTFPHQSTIDQFFDPVQFESYRQLGYRSMLAAIEALALDECANDSDQAYKAFVTKNAANRTANSGCNKLESYDKDAKA
jgi:hypothetical protein